MWSKVETIKSFDFKTRISFKNIDYECKQPFRSFGQVLLINKVEREIGMVNETEY